MTRLRVGYVLKMFPRLSETFVLNEILELQRQGAEVSAYSLMYPADGRFHAGVARLRNAIRYVPSGKHEALFEGIRRSAQPPRFEAWPEVLDFAERYRFPKPLEFVLRAQAIAQHVYEDGVEHLHAHFATISTRMAAAVGMLTGVPFSFTAHAKDIFRETVDGDLFCELVDRSHFCVTVSDYNKSFIEERFARVDRSKVVRLYNGVNLEALALPATVRGRHHLVSVGRLVPKKGFEVMLRAVARCRAEGLDLHVTIVGDGEQRDALEALRRQLDLEDDVTFTGGLSHERTLETLATATVVGLACLRDDDGNTDALPTVLLEALALGKPMVSTRLAGVPEIVGEFGALCEPGDVDGFAAGIRDTLRVVECGEFDPCAARARCEQRFDLRANAGSLLERFSRQAVAGTR